MELQDFIKNVLTDLVESVESVRKSSQRDMHLTNTKDNRTVEFDIAVTVENTNGASGKAGIKIFQVVEGGGDISKETKNSSISRIKFGVFIDTMTNQEDEERQAQLKAYEEENKRRYM